MRKSSFKVLQLVPARSIFLGDSKRFPLVNRLYMHPSTFPKLRPRSSRPNQRESTLPRPTTIGVAQAPPLRIDPLLRSFSAQIDPKNRFLVSSSTFPAHSPPFFPWFPRRSTATRRPRAQVRIIWPRVGSSGTIQSQKVLFGRIIRPMGGSSDHGDLTAIRSQNFLVVDGSFDQHRPSVFIK